MSQQAARWAGIVGPHAGLDIYQQAVFNTVAVKSWFRSGIALMARAEIVYRSRCSRSSVDRALRELVALEFLVPSSSTGKKTRYLVPWPAELRNADHEAWALYEVRWRSEWTDPRLQQTRVHLSTPASPADAPPASPADAGQVRELSTPASEILTPASPADATPRLQQTRVEKKTCVGRNGAPAADAADAADSPKRAAVLMRGSSVRFTT